MSARRQGWVLVGLLGFACGPRVIGDFGASPGDGGSANTTAGDTGSLAMAGSTTGVGGHANSAASGSAGAGQSPAGGGAQPLASGGAHPNLVGEAGSMDTGTTAELAGAGGQAGAQSIGDLGAGGGGSADTENDPPALTVLPIAHFKLDECDGPLLDEYSESTGARYDVGCLDGIDGKAAWFSGEPWVGERRRLEFPDDPRFAFTHELTVAAWVKPLPGADQYRSIVGKWWYYDVFELGIRQVVDGDGLPSERYSFTIAEPQDTWGKTADIISKEPVALDVWTHVAGVYRWSPDGQLGHIALYVNGKLAAESGTKLGTDGLQQSSRPIVIGTVYDGGDFVGAIDEVRLYDVALGPELAWLYLDPTHP